MSITVAFSDLLIRATGQPDPMELPVSTPLECLRSLALQMPVLNKWLFDETDKIKPLVWMLVNDERIYEDSFTKPLSDGDHLYIMMAVLGG